MKTTRTYLKGCDWCNAKGVIPNTNPAFCGNTSFTELCPVCNGTKTVTVTEVAEMPTEEEIGFGSYVIVEQKRYGCDNEQYDYKVINRLKSNTWVEVPVQSPAKEVLHDRMEDVFSLICCGVQETEVLKFRIKDVRNRMSKGEIAVPKKEPFKCYEIWRPNIPANGCETQCRECAEKEAEENRISKPKTGGEPNEEYADKSISIDEYMNMNPKLDPHEQDDDDDYHPTNKEKFDGNYLPDLNF